MTAQRDVEHYHLDSATAPRYTYAEADRLAGVSRGTSRRWLSGYAYRDGVGRPGVPCVEVVHDICRVELATRAVAGQLNGAVLTVPHSDSV